jgi:Tol biopolymer transport system component
LIAAKDWKQGDYQLWRISLPTGEVNRLTNDLNGYFRLSSTADSYALITVQRSALHSIWLAPNGQAALAKQLTSDAEHYDGLAWTQDDKIVYASDASGESKIWIMDAKGRDHKQLTHSQKYDHSPIVSSDSRSLFFLACESRARRACDIWRIDRDGSNLKQLTNGTHVIDIQRTPDGGWIVYTAPSQTQWSTLWKVAVDGANPNN